MMKIIGLFLLLSFSVMASKSSNLFIRGRVPASIMLVDKVEGFNGDDIRINVPKSKYQMNIQKTKNHKIITISFN